MDAASKRFLWTVIKRRTAHCCTVLTTHSMEECEALCGRIGVMVDGALRCLVRRRTPCCTARPLACRAASCAAHHTPHPLSRSTHRIGTLWHACRRIAPRAAHCATDCRRALTVQRTAPFTTPLRACVACAGPDPESQVQIWQRLQTRPAPRPSEVERRRRARLPA
eukprot:1951378-Prymnesium_polylepis.1